MRTIFRSNFVTMTIGKTIFMFCMLLKPIEKRKCQRSCIGWSTQYLKIKSFPPTIYFHGGKKKIYVNTKINFNQLNALNVFSFVAYTEYRNLIKRYSVFFSMNLVFLKMILRSQTFFPPFPPSFLFEISGTYGRALAFLHLIFVNI